MKLKKLIERIKAAKPDSLSEAELTAFVNEVEGFIHTEIHQLSLSDYKELDYASDGDVELSVAPPHDKLYFWYLWAMIDLAHGEYNNYSNALQKYNNDIAEYSRYVARVVRPAAGQAEKTGYYLSAYAIAVKHGFAGSEDEWVARLDSEVEQARSYAQMASKSAEASENEKRASEAAAGEAEGFAVSAKTSAEGAALSAERAEAASKAANDAAGSAASSAQVASDAVMTANEILAATADAAAAAQRAADEAENAADAAESASQAATAALATALELKWAKNMSYDNSGALLEAQNVQAAIDELAGKLKGLSDIDELTGISDWATVKELVDLGLAMYVFPVGHIFEDGELIWRVVNVNANELKLQCTKLLSDPMTWGGHGVTYEGSNIRKYLTDPESDFYSLVSEELAAAVSASDIPLWRAATNDTVYLPDKFFIPSVDEVYGQGWVFGVKAKEGQADAWYEAAEGLSSPSNSITPTRVMAGSWWLRSYHHAGNSEAALVYGWNGQINYGADKAYYILPTCIIRKGE